MEPINFELYIKFQMFLGLTNFRDHDFLKIPKNTEMLNSESGSVTKVCLQACYVVVPTIGRLAGEMTRLEAHIYSPMPTCHIYDCTNCPT